MTAKRFKLRLSKLGNGMITDTQKREDLYFDKRFLDATLPKATEWLNELAEENEVCKEAYNEIKSDAIRLKNENEQLKTTIQQLRTDNTKQKKKLNTTMKENEHIKQTIKEMINTERTELGKMTLRHLWRQIQ